jgi:hypothetical protein
VLWSTQDEKSVIKRWAAHEQNDNLPMTFLLYGTLHRAMDDLHPDMHPRPGIADHCDVMFSFTSRPSDEHHVLYRPSVAMSCIRSVLMVLYQPELCCDVITFHHSMLNPCRMRTLLPRPNFLTISHATSTSCCATS